MSANENHTADASNMVEGGSNSLPPSHEQLRPKIRQQLNDEMRSSLTGWLAWSLFPESARRLPTPLSDIRPRPRARCLMDGDLGSWPGRQSRPAGFRCRFSGFGGLLPEATERR